MEPINNLINKIYKYKILSIILIVLLTNIIHGLNVWQYTIYNFDPLHFKENSQDYILDAIIQMSNNGAFILNVFNSIFQPLLQIPVFYIISSIFVKSIIIYILFIIINQLINDKKISFTTALFFTISMGYTTHGVVLNGFWGAPIFFRASISGLMTLIGIYFLLNKKYYLAILPLIFSIHLHVLYGVTAFSFIFFSFIFYILLNLKEDIKKFLFLSFIVVLSILPILIGMDINSINIIDSQIDEWYKYVFSTDPDDMSMLYYLGTEGYFIAPFLSISIYFYINNKKKQMIDYLFMGSFIFLLIIMTVEILHYNSIFFDSLSEKFIGVQFRRGIWILLLFSAVINFFNIQKIITTIENIKVLYLFVALGFIYLFPNIIALYIVLLLYIIYFKEFKIIYLLILSCIFLYLGITLEFYHFSKSYNIFMYIFIATIVISSLIYYKIINIDNILFSIVIFFIVSMSFINFTKGIFINDLKIINNKGIFTYPDILKLEEDIYMKQGKIINKKIISYIRNNNPRKEFVLESMDNLYYGDAIIYNSPIFISRGNIAMPMFSKIYYEDLLSKLNMFDINGTMLFKSKDNTLKLIENRISSSSKNSLKLLNQKNKVKFLISKYNLYYMKPIVKENGYFLYDLEKE